MRSIRIGFVLVGFGLASCSGLQHRWTNAEFGYQVRTDFEPMRVAALLDDAMDRRIRALCALFGAEDLTNLRIDVHNARGQQLAPNAGVAGWHRSGEIHLYARQKIAGIEFLDSSSVHTLAHELVHALVERVGLKMPRWMEEGMCDVLAASAIDSHGDIVVWRDAKRERDVRKLRAAGHWLTAPQLLALTEHYPDRNQLAPMYAQAASFVGELMASGSQSIRARIDAMAGLTRPRLAERFDAWEAGVERGSPASFYREFVSSTDAAIRAAVGGQLSDLDKDETWWELAGRLLADPEPDVRSSVHIAALAHPKQDAATRSRFESWRRRPDQLGLAGLVGLAQCGDVDACIEFLQGVARLETANEWWQPVLWVAFTFGDLGSERLELPDVYRSVSDAAYLVAYCRAATTRIQTMHKRLEWNPRRGRYRLAAKRGG